MKTFIITSILALGCMAAFAQTDNPYKGTYDNKEYNVYLKLNLYDKNLTVPGQEIFGEVDGFLGDYKDSRKWLVTESTVKKDGTAKLSLINDYGSEDLKATLRLINDSTLQLTQDDGSTMKIARNRKWQKLPAKMLFIKKK